MNIERTIKKPSLTFKQEIFLIFIDLNKEELFNYTKSYYDNGLEEDIIDMTNDGEELIEKIKFLTEKLTNKLE